MKRIYVSTVLHESRELKRQREWAITEYTKLQPIIEDLCEARYSCHDIETRERDDAKLDSIISYAEKLSGIFKGWLSIDEPEAAVIKAAYEATL